MKSRKIWVISLMFGITMTFIVYFVLFSNHSETTSNQVTNLEKVENKGSTTKAKAAEREKTKRVINNPMVVVSEGKRAVSLKTVLETGVSGYLIPNSKVDIIAYETIIDDNTKKKFKSAVLVLQDIKVLASGKASDNNEESLQYETVTVEVTPEQGLTLGLASKDKDGFYFMLRNSKDKNQIENMKRETREVISEDKGE